MYGQKQLTENEMLARMLAGVSDIVARMTDNEIYSILLGVAPGYGIQRDVVTLHGYAAARALFTERAGTQMHAETWRLFSALAAQRLGHAAPMD